VNAQNPLHKREAKCKNASNWRAIGNLNREELPKPPEAGKGCNEEAIERRDRGLWKLHGYDPRATYDLRKG
jgi:hypothetical protein